MTANSMLNAAVVVANHVNELRGGDRPSSGVFRVDTLKIDQSFVRQISTEGEDTTIVAAMISMARSLKLRVVAEGVETAEELEFLRAHHCDEAQGYYFSRPVSAKQFALLLQIGIPDPDSLLSLRRCGCSRSDCPKALNGKTPRRTSA